MERVTRNVKNGSIVLFHNNAEHVLEYLPVILKTLQENGYEIVKINELIYQDNYHIDSQGCQISDLPGENSDEGNTSDDKSESKNNSIVTRDEKESEDE